MSEQFGFSTSSDEVAERFADQIKGKSILITGASWGGLGADAARAVAKKNPGLIVLACRKQASLDEVIYRIKEESPNANLRPLVLDLASLESVHAAAKEVNAYKETIDVLINSAGIMGSPFFKTKEGFEGHFGTNHIGHFVFTNLILPRMIESSTGEARIVSVSSRGHFLCPVLFEDTTFSNGAKYNRLWAYGQSKTANILFAKELSNRFGSKGVTAFSVHPGAIRTNLLRDMQDLDDLTHQHLTTYDGEEFWAEQIKWKTIPQGSATYLVAAFDPSIKNANGSFLQDCHLDNDLVKPYAFDDENARVLWQLSEKLVGQKFD